MTGQVMVIDRRVDADIDTVWRVLTDVPHHADVLRNVADVQIIDGSAYEVGLRWQETRSLLGHRGTETLEVTEAHAPHHTTVVAHTGRDDIRFSFAISPGQDGSTRILLTMAADLHGGAISRLKWATWGNVEVSKTRRMLRQDLDDFAIAAEGERVP